MNSERCILGIDLGTSSVKMILKSYDGASVKVKEGYEETTPAGWWNAVKKALARLDLTCLVAIGLSSQVGTYIVNGKDVIGWGGKEGAEELEEIRKCYSRELFLEEISMPHPNIISYPIPRLMYIKKHDPDVQKVCQPKDFLYEMLTGKCVTDQYSWRGLANLISGQYSQELLDGIGFSAWKLPELKGVLEAAAYTKEIPLDGNVLQGGIPVFTGMNDFFASLLGMGVYKTGDLFDITGTSEHLGVTESSVNLDTELVSGPYLSGNVHYGVTASSGASLHFCLRMFGQMEIDPKEILKNNPPLFLPYLNGERAPIWDPDARGMFYGIHGACEKEDMVYAVLEGVVFSLCHIYEYMGRPRANMMRVSGGAAANHTLNELKAELFSVPVLVPEETDTSALGAWIAAAVGLGWFIDFEEAIGQVCKTKEMIKPCGLYQKILQQRFDVYKKLYPTTKGI